MLILVHFAEETKVDFDTAREYFARNGVLNRTSLTQYAKSGRTVALFLGDLKGAFELVSPAATIVRITGNNLVYKINNGQPVTVDLGMYFATDGREWRETVNNPRAKRIVRR